jgi:hypothetical protein
VTRRRHIDISDHAVLRYLERVGGFDITGLRRSMEDRLRDHVVSTPQTVVIDGFRYLVKEGAFGPVLVTVIDKDRNVTLLGEDAP